MVTPQKSLFRNLMVGGCATAAMTAALSDFHITAPATAAPFTSDAPPSAEEKDAAKPAFELVSLRGKVVFWDRALRTRHSIKLVPEASERLLVLETSNGELHPLVEDIRGRAFRRDERFREKAMELLVRRYHGSPFVQIVRVFEVAEDGKRELDYWCEICSIAMFELKACDCCQGPIELRRRLVDEILP